MSASGISDANPIMPAAWSPQAPEGTPPPASAQEHRRRDADSGNPPKLSTDGPPKPSHAHRHKVDVRT